MLVGDSTKGGGNCEVRGAGIQAMSVRVFVYAFKGARLFARVCEDVGKESGGVISGLKRSGWRVFWRKI